MKDKSVLSKVGYILSSVRIWVIFLLVKSIDQKFLKIWECVWAIYLFCKYLVFFVCVCVCVCVCVVCNEKKELFYVKKRRFPLM